MNQSKTMVIISLTLFLLNHLNFGNQLIISWKNKGLGVWNPRFQQSYVCLLLGFQMLITYVSNLENKFCFFSAFAIKCYMSPSSLPILKPQLGTFFATENEKECGEGVTQCQRYIGEFRDPVNFYGFWIILYSTLNTVFPHIVSAETILFLNLEISCRKFQFLH